MRFPLRDISALIVLVTLTCSAVLAQQGTPVVLYTFDGSQPGERLGWSVAGPGDLNGDGVPDILAGGPGDFISGGFPGVVRAYSGLDGTVLYTVSGQQNADGFGMAIAALPDIDGDGRPDFAVGAPYDDANGVDSGSVYVFSGVTGAFINKRPGNAAGDAFGWALCNGNDFNSDTLPDLAVGAPLANSTGPDAGGLYLLDPISCVLISSISGPQPLAEVGYSVTSARAGGHVSVFAGAPGVPSPFGGAGVVEEWADNLPGFANTFAGQGFGSTVGLSLTGLSTVGGPAVVCEIRTSNSASIRSFYRTYFGGPLFECTEFSGQCTALALSDTAAPSSGQYLAGVVSGPTSPLGCRFLPPCNGSQLFYVNAGIARGWSIADIGGVNADSYRDFAMGDPFVASIGVDSGRVQVFLNLALYQPQSVYCTAKTNSQGCTPQVGIQGAPSLSAGDNFNVTATNVLNHKPGLMLWSLNQNNIPFGGGTLCVGPLFHRTGIQFSGGNPPPSDCSGSYSFHFSQAYMNAQALTPGVTVYCQYYSRDDGFPQPQNIGLTDAVRFTVLP
jgi:hypothetical protein